MTSRKEDAKKEAISIMKDDKKLSECIDSLSNSNRRERQKSATVIAAISAEDASLLVPYVSDLVDALNRPEAQTRWEVLEALTSLVDEDSRNVEKAIPGAESALFDEDSGPLRLSSMRFLCKFGSTTEARSEKVWPLIDEGIQCYHGDLEFQDMLIAVVDFSNGNLSKNVKDELSNRMKFDAENGSGVLKKRASQIIDNLS